MTPAQQFAQLQRFANWYITSDLELSCHPVRQPDSAWVWYDVRPMLDPREHSPELIDMATQALDYALETRLLVRHAQQHHLVRVLGAARAGAASTSPESAAESGR